MKFSWLYNTRVQISKFIASNVRNVRKNPFLPNRVILSNTLARKGRRMCQHRMPGVPGLGIRKRYHIPWTVCCWKDEFFWTVGVSALVRINSGALSRLGFQTPPLMHYPSILYELHVDLFQLAKMYRKLQLPSRILLHLFNQVYLHILAFLTTVLQFKLANCIKMQQDLYPWR